MLKGRWDRSRIIFMFAIVGIELIVCAYFSLYSQKMKASQILRLTQARQDLETYRNSAGQLTNLRNQYESSKRLLSRLEPGLPPERESNYFPTLLTQIQELANRTHIVMESFTPGSKPQTVNPPPVAAPSNGGAANPAPAQSAPPPDIVSCTLSLKGTFKQLLDFIDGLKSFPKILEITSIQLRPSSNDVMRIGKEPVLGININMNATIMPSSPGEAL